MELDKRPVTAARIWFLMRYRYHRSRGRYPLDAAQLAYGDALQTDDPTRRAWRKFYAERYFKIINMRRGVESTSGMYWRFGRTSRAFLDILAKD